MRALVERAWRAVAWYVNGVTGQSKYDAYLAHERAAHPDCRPLTRREYWQAVYSEQDNSPSPRCC